MDGYSSSFIRFSLFVITLCEWCSRVRPENSTRPNLSDGYTAATNTTASQSDSGDGMTIAIVIFSYVGAFVVGVAAACILYRFKCIQQCHCCRISVDSGVVITHSVEDKTEYLQYSQTVTDSIAQEPPSYTAVCGEIL